MKTIPLFAFDINLAAKVSTVKNSPIPHMIRITGAKASSATKTLLIIPDVAISKACSRDPSSLLSDGGSKLVRVSMLNGKL